MTLLIRVFSYSTLFKTRFLIRLLVLKGFFGILFAALYNVKTKEDRHFLVYDEAEFYGTKLLQHAFQLSIEFTTKESIMQAFENRILHLSLQVRLCLFVCIIVCRYYELM